MRRIVPFILALSSSLSGQEARDTARVEPVVVSATRTAVAIGLLPVAVTVLRGDDLRLRGVTSIGDALQDLSSAAVAQSGSYGATTSLFLRGGESKYVKVLIDGVPVNDPGGVYDFASLTIDNVDRIEVVRGPTSVVHGADAVTGVVNIISRGGRGGPQQAASVALGSAARIPVAAGSPQPGPMRSIDATWSFAGATPTATFALGVARHEATGLYAFNNRYQNHVLSGRFTFAPASGTALRVALRHNDYRFNYPTDFAGDPVDSNAYRVEDRTVIGVELERAVSSRLRSIIAVNSSINEGGTDDAADAAGNSFVSQDKVRRRSADWRVQALVSRVVATLGAATEHQDQRSQSQSQSPFGPFYDVFKASRSNSAVYGEALVHGGSRTTATFGVRLDDNQRFGRFLTGRVGATWRPWSGTRVRATAGTAFREPSFFENYAAGFVTGNPDLEPEQARSADAAVEQDLAGGRVQVSAGMFAQRFRNMIDYSVAGACGYNYCNVAEAEANGLEFEAGARVVAGLSAALNATFLATRVVTPGYDASPAGTYVAGEPLIRRPGRKLTADLTWRNGGPLSLNGRVLTVGTRGDRDFHGPTTLVTLDSYTRVDVGAEWATTARGALVARVENLTDAAYQNVFNYLAPRRTIALGFRIGQ